MKLFILKLLFPFMESAFRHHKKCYLHFVLMQRALSVMRKHELSQHRETWLKFNNMEKWKFYIIDERLHCTEIKFDIYYCVEYKRFDSSLNFHHQVVIILIHIVTFSILVTAVRMESETLCKTTDTRPPPCPSTLNDDIPTA